MFYELFILFLPVFFPFYELSHTLLLPVYASFCRPQTLPSLKQYMEHLELCSTEYCSQNDICPQLVSHSQTPTIPCYSNSQSPRNIFRTQKLSETLPALKPHFLGSDYTIQLNMTIFKKLTRSLLFFTSSPTPAFLIKKIIFF